MEPVPEPSSEPSPEPVPTPEPQPHDYHTRGLSPVFDTELKKRMNLPANTAVELIADDVKKLIALAKVACKPPHVVFHSEKHSPHLTGTKATFSPWQLQSEPYKSHLCQWGKSLLRIDTKSEFPSIVVFPDVLEIYAHA